MYTPVRKVAHSAFNGMASPTNTPHRTPLNFSRELREVLQERNLLTAKSRRKVCAMLGGGGGSGAASPNPEVHKRVTFRLQAVEEIITSEKTYLQQLETLMQFFVRPLKEQGIIDEGSHTTLFGQIEMIHNLNGEFLRQLELNRHDVAHAFLKMAPFFKLYSVYAFDYRNALFVLQDLTSKNPIFRKFLAQTESRPEVQRKLNSLMIVPIQRVPRYKLLLEQVLLYTSPADGDYKLLKESVKQIESTVSHINSCVEDQEVTQMLINLQNSLVHRTPNIVKPSRKVIKEGVLQKVTRNGKEIKRYCVLMSDIFMYCKILKERTPNTVVENSLECCCIFPLKKTKVYEMLPGNFKITCQGDGIIFGTTDLQLGQIWVGLVRDAIDMHIQCRKTLRKESSKRTPLRRKDVKNFDNDYVLSPSRRKCDYESVFRHRNASSDSENDSEDGRKTNCFSRKKCAPILVPPQATSPLPPNHILTVNVPINRKGMKRPAPPPPLPAPGSEKSEEATTANRISRLYKFIATSDKTRQNPGILKRPMVAPNAQVCQDYDVTYGFAGRYSDTKSYLRAHSVDNAIPSVLSRDDVLGDGNFRDVLFPLRSSGGSGKSVSGVCTWSVPHAYPPQVGKENGDIYATPPLKKRVKFDESKDCVRGTPTPFNFPNAELRARTSLREKIYDFFAKLF